MSNDRSIPTLIRQSDMSAALALAVRSSPGIYAILLGSGVSRAAKIMSGWEITLDLTRKLAALKGEPDVADPEQWYRKQFGHEPDYAAMLDALSQTQADRAQLLKGYFERTREHIERAERLPTAAHRAVATLVSKGYVRVVITTNFDRLLEEALAAQGVQPQVVSTANQAAGMIPLIHSKCTVIKANGDYLDQRIRNTPAELSTYEPAMNSLLDTVVDMHGLLVCGWSAEYDTALRGAIERATNRRYSTYWAKVGDLSERATSLVASRQAQVVDVTGADEFFGTLTKMVSTLEAIDSHHPIVLPLVVAELKEAIEKREPISKHDLLTKVADDVITRLTRFTMDAASRAFDEQELLLRVSAYESLAAPLIGLMITGAAWEDDGDVGEYSRLVSRVTGLTGFVGGDDSAEKLKRYPALLLVYAAGIACVAKENYKSLAKILRQNYRQPLGGQSIPLPKLLNAVTVIAPETGKLLPGLANRALPTSDWILDRLRPYLREYFVDDIEYADAFSQFEYLLALVYADMSDSIRTRWVPLGRFAWYGRDDADGGPTGRMQKKMKSAREYWPPFAAGMFARQYVDFEKLVEEVDAFRSGFPTY